jgi:aminoglycoside phosphotransferase (APT) family kinase protein
MLDTASFQAFLDHSVPDQRPTVSSCVPISGGYSRMSAIADVTWGGGRTERFVLRADPAADSGVFISDRDAEWALLVALYDAPGVVPIPRPRWYDDTGEFFGTKCIIIEYFDGVPLQELARSAERVGAVTEDFVATLVHLHQTPLDVLPVAVVCPPAWDTYIDDVVAMIRELDQGLSEHNPIFPYVATLLRRYRPPPVPLTLVHGDCQPSNVMANSEGQTVVIDWEFARIGDPREDLGHYSQMPVLPNLYWADPAGFIARYRAGSGMTADQLNEDVVDYFMLLGEVRMIRQMIQAADSLANGRSRGVMAPYLINATSLLARKYVAVARRLDASPKQRPTGDPV